MIQVERYFYHFGCPKLKNSISFFLNELTPMMLRAPIDLLNIVKAPPSGTKQRLMFLLIKQTVFYEWLLFGHSRLKDRSWCNEVGCGRCWRWCENFYLNTFTEWLVQLNVIVDHLKMSYWRKHQIGEWVELTEEVDLIETSIEYLASIFADRICIF